MSVRDRPSPGQGSARTGWNTVRLVAGREIRERLQGRLIPVMTVVTAVLVVAAVAIPGLLAPGPATDHLALVGPRAQSLRQALSDTSARAKRKLVITELAAAGAARPLLSSGRIDAALCRSTLPAPAWRSTSRSRPACAPLCSRRSISRTCARRSPPSRSP